MSLSVAPTDKSSFTAVCLLSLTVTILQLQILTRTPKCELISSQKANKIVSSCVSDRNYSDLLFKIKTDHILEKQTRKRIYELLIKDMLQ